MMLRRGLMVSERWVVDSDPERDGALVDRDDVRVVLRDVFTNARQAWPVPADQRIPVFGVLADRPVVRTGAGARLLQGAGVAA
jgi:hypothetical protein